MLYIYSSIQVAMASKEIKKRFLHGMYILKGFGAKKILNTFIWRLAPPFPSTLLPLPIPSL